MADFDFEVHGPEHEEVPFGGSQLFETPKKKLKMGAVAINSRYIQAVVENELSLDTFNFYPLIPHPKHTGK